MKDLYHWMQLWAFLLLSLVLFSSVIPFLISSRSTELMILGIFLLPLVLLFFIVTLKKVIQKGKKLFLKEIQK